MLNKIVQRLFEELVELIPEQVYEDSNMYKINNTPIHLQFVPRIASNEDRDNKFCKIVYRTFEDFDIKEFPKYPKTYPDSVLYDFYINFSGRSYKLPRYDIAEYSRYMSIIEKNRNVSELNNLNKLVDEIVQNKSVDNGLF